MTMWAMEFEKSSPLCAEAFLDWVLMKKTKKVPRKTVFLLIVLRLRMQLRNRKLAFHKKKSLQKVLQCVRKYTGLEMLRGSLNALTRLAKSWTEHSVITMSLYCNWGMKRKLWQADQSPRGGLTITIFTAKKKSSFKISILNFNSLQY